MAAVSAATNRAASRTRMSRSKNCLGVGSTGSASWRSLVASAKTLDAAHRLVSRSCHRSALSAACSRGVSRRARRSSAKARPSHLLYGAHRRSIKNASFIIAGYPRRDDPRAEVVAAATGPPDERFLLVDPQPTRGQDIAPDVVRVPAQRVTPLGQERGRVVKHRTPGAWRGSAWASSASQSVLSRLPGRIRAWRGTVPPR